VLLTRVHVAESTAVKGGQQALLAQWTAAATESRQSRDDVLRLAAALAVRDADVAALRGAAHKQNRRHCAVSVERFTVQQSMHT